VKSPALQHFLELLQNDPQPLGLFKEVCLLSAIEEPGMFSHSIEEKLAEQEDALEEMAQPLRDRWPEPPEEITLETLQILAQVFSTKLGFHGDIEDYANPHNSCLPMVMEKRTGLPITLSVLMISLGEIVGIPLVPVGGPGHFVVGAKLQDRMIYIDPFHHSTVMEEEDLINAMAARFLPQIEPTPDLIQAVDVPSVLYRMLNNLRNSYLEREKTTKLLETLRWMSALAPDEFRLKRDRGLLELRLGDEKTGAMMLLQYVRQAEDASDFDVIKLETARAIRRIQKNPEQ